MCARIRAASRTFLPLLVAMHVPSAVHAQAVPAAHPEATLRYTRGPGAERCPDDETLRTAVAARLGYDPFRAEAPIGIEVAITRAGHGLRAAVRRDDPSFPRSPARVLTSPSADCGDLAEAVALTIGIAIDPIRAAGVPTAVHGRAPEPAALPAPVVAPAPPPVQRAPTLAPRATRVAPAASVTTRRIAPRAGTTVAFRVAVLGGVAFAAAPAVAPTAAVSLGLRAGAFTGDLEARADLPTSMEVAPDTSVTTSLLLLHLVPCVHFRFAVGCAVAGAGALRGAVRTPDDAQSLVTPFVVAGARLGVEIPIYGPITLRGEGEVLATVTRVELRVNGRLAWSTPPASAVLLVGVAAHFP